MEGDEGGEITALHGCSTVAGLSNKSGRDKFTPRHATACARRVYSWVYSFSSTGSSSQPVAAREPVGPQSSAGVRPLLQPLPPGSKGGLQASL